MDKPILDRIKSVIQSADDIARSLKIEHEDAKRIYQLMLLQHVALLERASQASDISEGANQDVLNSSDQIEAQADLITSQYIHERQMIAFADKQDDARQIAQTQDVLFAGDPISIKHVLLLPSKFKLTEAARLMKPYEIADIIDALLKAVDD